MAPGINRTYENKPLAEYRLKVRSTKWFLKRFYTPVWFQKPTRASLLASLAFWATGLLLVLYYRTSYPAAGRAGFLVNLMVVTTTLTMAGMCYSYYKSRKNVRMLLHLTPSTFVRLA